MVSSKTVANRLLELARRDGRKLTPMQLLKLVFLCHGWTLGVYGRQLISDRVEAWKYGPVIPELYHSVKNYRSGPVRGRIPAPIEKLDDEEAFIVNEVYRAYGDWDGLALSHLTHEAGSPWDQTFDETGWGLIIPNGLIKDFYQKLANAL